MGLVIYDRTADPSRSAIVIEFLLVDLAYDGVVVAGIVGLRQAIALIDGVRPVDLPLDGRAGLEVVVEVEDR